MLLVIIIIIIIIITTKFLGYLSNTRLLNFPTPNRTPSPAPFRNHQAPPANDKKKQNTFYHHAGKKKSKPNN